MLTDEENRKRNLQQDDIGAAISSKRAALGGSTGQLIHHSGQSNNEANLFFKLLCPQPLTGMIIGRGGSILNQLNVSTGAKIQLSQNEVYFPTTNERVLVVSGNRENLANAINELVTRIAEAPERKNSTPSYDMYGNVLPPANRTANGMYQIKLVIPKTASGTLIGKGGIIIKHMSDISSCKMQLGDEADPFGTNERIFIIQSTTIPFLVHGAQTVMIQLLSDPKMRTYSNTTCNYPTMSGIMPYQPMVPAGMPAAMRPPSHYIPPMTAVSAAIPVPAKVNQPIQNTGYNMGASSQYGQQQAYGSMPPQQQSYQGISAQTITAAAPAPQVQQQYQYQQQYQQQQQQQYQQQQYQQVQGIATQQYAMPMNSVAMQGAGGYGGGAYVMQQQQPQQQMQQQYGAYNRGGKK